MFGTSYLAKRLCLRPASTSEDIREIVVVDRMNDESLFRDCTYQLMELSLDIFKAVEDVCVVKFQIVHHECLREIVQKLRAAIEEGCVVLVGFDNKEWVCTISRRYLEIQRDAADQKTRIHSCVLKDPGDHASSRCLSVSTCYGYDPSFSKQVSPQPFCARQERNIVMEKVLDGGVASS